MDGHKPSDQRANARQRLSSALDQPELRLRSLAGIFPSQTAQTA
jgi:hypothetical protein